MLIESKISEGTEGFLDAYRLQEKTRESREPEWLSSQRRRAIELFLDTGFPTTRDEDWRYTNVSAITQTSFQQTVQPGQSIPSLKTWDEPVAARLVFVNGIFSSGMSTLAKLPGGTIVGDLGSQLENPKTADVLRVYFGRTLENGHDAFPALNAALWNNGACVLIPVGTALKEPIHIIHLSRAADAPVVSYPRTLIVCERDAQVTVVEEYIAGGEGVAFSNSVTEVIAGENSVVEIFETVNENTRSSHIGRLNAYVGRSAQVSILSSTLSGALVRNEVHAILDAEGADCTLNGLYAAKDFQHVDNHTTVDHAKPHGSSRQLYNGILDGHATGVFNGRVIVRPDAQKTDAVQKNRNLLLSTDAAIDTKPQLEISANDVRCTHGATVGQMDQEALFFLRTRGLDRADAASLLVQAFAGEILDKVKISGYRHWLENELRTKFLAPLGERN